MSIHQAGPMGLFKTILILLLVYYAFKFLMKLFGPYLLKKAVDRVQNKAQEKYGQHRENPVLEGKTVIDKKPNNKPESNNSVGEYVDFEEID